MKFGNKCVLSIGVLGLLVAGLVFPAGASHSGGLTQTVSAVLNLPAVLTPSVEICTEANPDGTPKEESCKKIEVGADARTLGLSMTYTLVNASHLPSVSAVAGSAAVPCPGTTEKKTGIALIAEEANFKSGSSGNLSVNGQPVQKVEPGSPTTFYPAQAIFLRFCTI